MAEMKAINTDYRMRKEASMNRERFKTLEDRVIALEAVILSLKDEKVKRTPKEA